MFFKLVGLVGGGFPPENRSGVSENQSFNMEIDLDGQTVALDDQKNDLDGQKVGLDCHKAVRRAPPAGRNPQKLAQTK